MKVYIVAIDLDNENWPFCEFLCVCESEKLAHEKGSAYVKANYDKCQSYSVDEYDLLKEAPK